MKTLQIIPAFLFLIFFSLSPKAQASCGLSITASDIVLTWNLNFTSIAVSVQVSRSTSDACNFSLSFSKGGAASYPTRRVTDGSHILRYQLYQDSGLTKILQDTADVTSVDQVVQGGFQAGATPTTQTVNYYLEIPYNLATTPSLVSAGSYLDTFIISVFESDTPPFVTAVATKSVNISVTVSQMIALSLINSGGSFQLGQLTRNATFPTLTEGSTKTMDLRVRTNAGFTVTFSSTNNGTLAHTNPAKNSHVPYSLLVNGSSLNLSNSKLVPVTGLSGSGSTNLEGLAYPIKVVIGSVTGAGVLAGPHADDVTITATTTE